MIGLVVIVDIVVVVIVVVVVGALFDSRYLSHGQEWSERLRFKETTKIIKYSLDPVWDEEFLLPVRRYIIILGVLLYEYSPCAPHQ